MNKQEKFNKLKTIIGKEWEQLGYSMIVQKENEISITINIYAFDDIFTSAFIEDIITYTENDFIIKVIKERPVIIAKIEDNES